jgi:lysophospholipase L1-like esterase
MRIGRISLLCVCLFTAAACDRLGGGADSSPTAPSGPPASGSIINYSVVGASDAIGYGSSRPCVLYDDCDGNGYVWVAARSLRSQGFTVNVQPLGIPGAVISRTFEDLAIQYGRNDVLANFIQQEVPFVKHEASLVTVFTGANDINVMTTALGKGAGGADPIAFIDQVVAGFTSDFATLISGIRSRSKSARIIVINLPNLAGLPYLATASLAQKQAAQRAAVRITTAVINPTPDVTVVDLMCDPRFYQAANISSDGFHPNDAGYSLLGSEIVKALTSSAYPVPKSSCAQMVLF